MTKLLLCATKSRAKPEMNEKTLSIMPMSASKLMVKTLPLTLTSIATRKVEVKSKNTGRPAGIFLQTSWQKAKKTCNL